MKGAEATGERGRGLRNPVHAGIAFASLMEWLRQTFVALGFANAQAGKET